MGFYYASMLSVPIISCVLGFILTALLTIVIGIRNGFADVKLETMLHIIPLTLLIVLFVDDSELIKAKRITTAYLRDDIGGMEMILKEQWNIRNEFYRTHFGETKTFWTIRNYR